MEFWPAFETRVPGKWVLAGEHAVLRGAMAVALSHPEFDLHLRFEPFAELDGPRELRIEPPEAEGWLKPLLEHAPGLGLLDASAGAFPYGSLQIESSIPSSAGLGSSAALCVAVVRWLSARQGLDSRKVTELATRLENHFHGRSSGMDVATVCLGGAITFSMNWGAKPLSLKRMPRFSFHDTGLRASTRDCVAQVETWRVAHPQEADEVDQEMKDAAVFAEAGLRHYGEGTPRDGLEQISWAMGRAQACFRRWGLLPPEAEALERELLSRGALAVKLTGAGKGGFLVALWPS